MCLCITNTSISLSGLFLLNALKRSPTKSSVAGLPRVQRLPQEVLRFHSESRVRFRDSVHGSSLTASRASSLSLQACYISWKNGVTCFNSDQSLACNDWSTQNTHTTHHTHKLNVRILFVLHALQTSYNALLIYTRLYLFRLYLSE